MRLIDAEALDKARIDYIVSGYANNPKDCSEFGMMIIKAPTVCDIEQIRAEIKHLLNRPPLTHVVGYDKGFVDGIDKVLQIIDRHIETKAK